MNPNILLNRPAIRGHELRKGVESFAHHICAGLKLRQVRVEWHGGVTTAAINAYGDMLLAAVRDDALIKRADVLRYLGFVVHELLHRRYTDFSVECRSSDPRMLRVLQDKNIHRVGGASQVKVDIRIIAATHQNLHEMVKKRLFRDDLWFRLNVFPIVIPPLRDRQEDIPALVNHFIEKKSKELQIPHIPKLVPGAMAPLMEYNWPGNVRELENVIERALILSKGRPLTFGNIVWPEDNRQHGESNVLADDFLNLDQVISKHIKQALNMTKGRVHGPSGAAHLLGLNPSTLRHRMRKIGILHGRGKR